MGFNTPQPDTLHSHAYSVQYEYFHSHIFLISMQGQNPVREDITELKEDINTFKQEMMVRAFKHTLTHLSVWSKH